MKSAWGDKYQRAIEQIEIIDIKGDAELQDTWKISYILITLKSIRTSINP